MKPTNPFLNITENSAALLGRMEAFSLRHRLFNAICLGSAIASLIASITNLIIGFSIWESVFLFLFSIEVSFFYYVGRYLHNYKNLLWPAFFSFILILIYAWFNRGGTGSGASFYFLVISFLAPYLFKGKSKYVAAFISYMLLFGLVYIEFRFPEIIQFHEDRTMKYADIFANLLFSMLMVSFIVIFTVQNFSIIYEKVQEYKTHFYEDLVLARILQEQIFKYDPSILSDYDCDIIYRPAAELSGDLYDFSKKPQHKLRIMLADARGHGINSSLSSMIIKSEWTGINNNNHSGPARLMTKLNRQISERYGDSISFSAIIADITGNKIVYASGGHIPQYIVNKKSIEEIESTGPVLGMMPNSKYKENTVPFTSGSKLFLFTDALIEELDKNGKTIGEKWLHDILLKMRGSSKHINNEILKQLAKLKDQKVERLDFTDDLTIIAIGKKGK